MDPRLQAALPLLVSAGLTLVASPVVDSVVHHTVKRFYEAHPLPAPPAQRTKGRSASGPREPDNQLEPDWRYLPESLADAVSWGIDQFVAFFQIIVSPTLALIFVPLTSSGAKIIGLGYGVGALGSGAVYSLIHKQSEPSTYVATCKASEIKGVGRLLQHVPFVRDISWGVLGCTGVLLLGALVAALVTPVPHVK